MASGLVADNIPIPIITTDNNGIVLSFNTRAETFFPLESGLQLSTIFTKSSKIFYHTYIFPTLVKEKEVSELFIYAKNRFGEKSPFFINAELNESTDGKTIYWVLFLAKERDKYEKNLISLKNTLSEKTEYLNKSLKDNELIGSELSSALLFKERAFTILSHDLRSPINAISALAELLMDLLDDDHEKRELLNHIIKSAANIHSLINELTIWSKLISTNTSSSGKPINTQVLSERELSLLNSSLLLKNLRIDNKIESFYVRFDEQVFRFVLRNLINNAIKFSPNSSTISLKTKVENHFIRISVSDQGKGVEPSIADTIFSSEIKTTTIGTNQEIGSGIGLPLCKQMLEMRGGSIDFHNNQEAGSTFFFNIPFDQSATT